MSKILPTIPQMIGHLDRFVAGQQRPKRDLATAVYNHYMLLALNRRDEMAGLGAGMPPRQNLLLIGPTGSGKSHMVRTLAEYLDLPFVEVTATSLSKQGYVGDSVGSIVDKLYEASGFMRARAERGIIFIDEIDKIRANPGVVNDVGGGGVQEALLTLIEGREFNFGRPDMPITVDVSKVLFICAGAFAGLPKIIARRLSGEMIEWFRDNDADQLEGRDPDELINGLQNSEMPPIPEDVEQDLLDRWETRDLQTYGLIPEFVGRFSAISALRKLRKADLIQLIAGIESAPLAQQKAHFALHGIELVFEQSALEALAEIVLKLKIGARGIRRAVLKALDAVDYRLPELARSGVTRIIYRREHIHGNREPVMERGTAPSKDLTVDALRSNAFGDAVATLRPKSLKRVAPIRVVSDTTGWNDKEVADRLQEVTSLLHALGVCTAHSQWWIAQLKEHRNNQRRLLRVAEEMLVRGMRICEMANRLESDARYTMEGVLMHRDFDQLRQWSPTSGEAAPAPFENDPLTVGRIALPSADSDGDSERGTN
jgi:ATP-dependent Clp protease ATP-binding subunit ClpX